MKYQIYAKHRRHVRMARNTEILTYCNVITVKLRLHYDEFTLCHDVIMRG